MLIGPAVCLEHTRTEHSHRTHCSLNMETTRDCMKYEYNVLLLRKCRVDSASSSWMSAWLRTSSSSEYTCTQKSRYAFMWGHLS